MSLSFERRSKLCLVYSQGGAPSEGTRSGLCLLSLLQREFRSSRPPGAAIVGGQEGERETGKERERWKRRHLFKLLAKLELRSLRVQTGHLPTSCLSWNSDMSSLMKPCKRNKYMKLFLIEARQILLHLSSIFGTRLVADGTDVSVGLFLFSQGSGTTGSSL